MARAYRRRCGTVALLALAAFAMAGCAGATHPATQDASVVRSPRYYVSVGDSLAVGVQPTASGESLPTNAGYPDRIYSALQARQPGWHLVKLGCSGETTRTMIRGGICRYPAGSQLAEAEQFLRAHRGHIGLVTIDIGANDPNQCVLGTLTFPALLRCMNTSIPETKADLRTIMSGLRSAAGPSVPIIAMSYYVPELAGWLHGQTGKELAVLTERLVAGYNTLLDGIYRHYGARIANVFGAFRSADFTGDVHVAGYGSLPENVATICRWTWSCAPGPRGPNEHANDTGYRVIAQTFLRADPQFSR
jgi:lysophospholipase L1-like esterase